MANDLPFFKNVILPVKTNYHKFCSSDQNLIQYCRFLIVNHANYELRRENILKEELAQKWIKLENITQPIKSSKFILCYDFLTFCLTIYTLFHIKIINLKNQ